MAESDLRYDRMVEEALRSVVGKALIQAAEHGLPGDHHFYITFHTEHPGVMLPDHLRQRYPDEMTIVLQHQFWGLEVGPEAFGITLSFNEVPERMTIPFAAVTAFADPSVRFGLQFDIGDGKKNASGEEVGISGDASMPEAGAANAPASKDAGKTAAEKTAPSSDAESTDAGSTDAGSADKVVTLDAFRKK